MGNYLITFVTYPSKKNLPEDGFKRWPKHVGLQRL